MNALSIGKTYSFPSNDKFYRSKCKPSKSPRFEQSLTRLLGFAPSDHIVFHFLNHIVFHFFGSYSFPFLAHSICWIHLLDPFVGSICCGNRSASVPYVSLHFVSGTYPRRLLGASPLASHRASHMLRKRLPGLLGPYGSMSSVIFFFKFPKNGKVV